MNPENEARLKEAYLGARHYYNISGAWDVPHDGPVDLGPVKVTDWDRLYDFIASDKFIAIDEFVEAYTPAKDRLLLVTPLVGFKV